MTGSGGTLERAVADGNRGNGIEANRAAISDSTAHGNGVIGIRSAGRVERSSASGNGQDGLDCNACIATGNQLNDNDGNGATFAFGSIAGSNALLQNGVSDADIASPSTFVESVPNFGVDGSC